MLTLRQLSQSKNEENEETTKSSNPVNLHPQSEGYSELRVIDFPVTLLDGVLDGESETGKGCEYHENIEECAYEMHFLIVERNTRGSIAEVIVNVLHCMPVNQF